MSRTGAREVAVMMQYAGLLGGRDTPNDIRDKTDGCCAEALDDEDLTYVNQVVAGVDEHIDRIDELVKKYSVDWSIDRIARVDLSILRVAIYEMLYREDVPAGAAINEAVELAKRYGGERSYAFINGILGSVAKEIKIEAT